MSLVIARVLIELIVILGFSFLGAIVFGLLSQASMVLEIPADFGRVFAGLWAHFPLFLRCWVGEEAPE